VKDFSATTPIMLMAPAGAPMAIVNRLNDSVADALADPAVKDKLLGLGAETEMLTPAALTTFLQNEDKAIEDLARGGLLKSEG